ncbi:DUF2165 family protein [Microbulbifer guangxiensis]|uniref:DUF2165 family protein n=1 Tax=Microbulbifer guangxiensis TaxID=2904249 RepID=UPI001F185367|nr:DUF2165 family protein [Microbulbifer guangxiensis]
MHVRLLKIMFTVYIGLFALIYVLQNIANTDAAYGHIHFVLSGQGHNAYPSSIGFFTSSLLMTWITLVIIFGLELLTGIVLLKGAIDMWRSRKADAGTFHAAKKWALLGAGLGITVWFGLFILIGGGFFNMWQTPVGGSSFNGSFQIFGAMALCLIFLNQQDYDIDN